MYILQTTKSAQLQDNIAGSKSRPGAHLTVFSVIGLVDVSQLMNESHSVGCGTIVFLVEQPS